jgi:hypothetical protein
LGRIDNKQFMPGGFSEVQRLFHEKKISEDLYVEILTKLLESDPIVREYVENLMSQRN